MTDKADAWMPLWIGAYLADTMHLSTVQHGAYLLLLMAYWRAGAALPDDDEELRAIARCDASEWKRVRPKVEKFFRVENGAWWHKRVEAELASADNRKQAAAERAEKAAAARWKDKPRNPSGDARGHPQAFLKHSSSIPENMLEECSTPSPTPSSLRSEDLTSLRLVADEVENPTSSGPPPKANGHRKLPACPVEKVVALYHELLPELPKVEQLTEGRRGHIRQRWRDAAATQHWESAQQGIAHWRELFDWVRKSDFLMGKKKPRPPRTVAFVADFDFLIEPASHVKILEGKYHHD